MMATRAAVYFALPFCAAVICTSASATADPAVKVSEPGSGLNHEVAVEVASRFRVVFEARKNYGITKWFDLNGDPTARTDLLANPTNYIPQHAQGALFNQCVNPGDLIGHVAAGGSLHKDVPRSIKVVTTHADHVVIENQYSPMLGSVNRDLIFQTRYVIHADGRIYVRSKLSATQAQKITMWRNSIITLGDPTFHTKFANKLAVELTGPQQLKVSGADWKPNEWVGYVVEQKNYRHFDVVSNTRNVLTVKPQDANKRANHGLSSIQSNRTRFGWLRCDSLSRPIKWHREPATFLYAFWDPKTPAPYQQWTKASILLVPSATNPKQGRGGRLHGWRGCKRLFFEIDAFELDTDESITQNYLIHLGTRGGALPDLSKLKTCQLIAKQYRSEKRQRPITR